uniref:Uncharacterized protein LOC109549168 isoform X3 n=1 Tax=Tursiops truncatus TaxID=9739 RepID=A0A6J3RXZ8_TURTR|nr:uncharacterized protein LOC109549168 isoform X3 [Tursiops truncatus]
MATLINENRKGIAAPLVHPSQEAQSTDVFAKDLGPAGCDRGSVCNRETWQPRGSLLGSRAMSCSEGFAVTPTAPLSICIPGRTCCRGPSLTGRLGGQEAWPFSRTFPGAPRRRPPGHRHPRCLSAHLFD